MHNFALIAFIFIFSAEAVLAKTIRHYDERGRYAGKSVANEKVIKHYDDRGRLKGVSRVDQRK